MRQLVKTYSIREERINVLTHALGIVLSCIGIPLLLFKIPDGYAWQYCLGIGAFGFGLVSVYTSSTIYHALSEGYYKRTMQIIDHIAIFFLIGGTYTAFILLFFNETFGHQFLLLHWAIIAFGILFTIFFKTRYDYISLALYLVVGWMVIAIYEPITSGMGTATLYFLFAGGISYSLGVIFYVWRKVPFHHAIWHLFVLGGSAAHFLGLYYAL